jgi:hypothetical protein
MNATTRVRYQNIDGNDLAQFKGVRTQAVVSRDMHLIYDGSPRYHECRVLARPLPD